MLEAQWKADIARARLANRANETGRRDWIEEQAAFWANELRKAPPEHKPGLRERVLAEAQDLTMEAAIREGVYDYGDPRYDSLPVHDDMRRFVGLATGEIVRLEEHLDAYVLTLRCTEKTAAMKLSTIRKFLANHPYSADVTRRAVQTWIDEQARAGAAVATMRRSMSEMRGFWTFLRGREVVPEDKRPFDDITMPKPRRKGDDDQRRPFRPAEAVTLWRAAQDAEDHDLADVVEIGMWSGCRLGEICALTVEAVDLKAGAFTVADAKTPAGKRQVPIHPRLLPTMTRLVGTRETGHLLPGLGSANQYGDRSVGVGKRFQRLKTKHGFGAAHVFHSLRKPVATLLEDAGVPENTAADILGHEKPRITYGLYSGGASLAVKAEALAKIEYRPGAE